jgi:transcriptional regulator with AAA-type ATPase domain
MRQVSTTLPSARTEQGTAAGHTLAVRWVFPSEKVTVLKRIHVVGRDDGCDTTLPGSEISRRHAEFRVDGPVVAVRDLESRNGVFVNGVSHPDAQLELGDVVRCGEWIGVLVSEPEGSPGFQEIAPGWYGGSKLSAAVSAAKRIVTAEAARSTRPTSIVIQGKTGTGKEGIARALHDWSRLNRPFVAVNCAALPTDLVEAELFGHKKGAFTNADAANPGLFRAADGGSIFLDEILELPMAQQAKVLRVLQERQVRAVGETRDISIDVRVIAATQEPLGAAVADKRFRADLQARLEGLTVVLPALRERREDIAPLFLRFLREHAGGRPPAVEAKLVEALCLYDWPTNVRELLLMTRRLLGVHGHEPVLKKAHLPEPLLPRARLASQPGIDRLESQKRTWRKTDDESEFEALVAALRANAGSVGKASVALGITRARAYRLLAAHPEFSIGDLRQ